MRNLLEFLSKYNHWFVFVVLEIISIILLFQYNTYQGSVWFTSANSVAGKVYELSAEVEKYFSLVDVNQQLSLRNIEQERQINILEQRILNTTKDSSSIIVNNKDLFNGFQIIPAKVITNSINENDNLITLDKGRAEGITPNMGVVSGLGVVGIVHMVSEHYSIVLSVLNSKSNISCTIKNKGYLGYLHWSKGASDYAFLDDIPRHAHFRMNDEIITSGYSSIFPQGIIVGKITNAYNSADGLSYRLKVKLATNFSTLRDVFIINNAPMLERIELMRAAQDSIIDN